MHRATNTQTEECTLYKLAINIVGKQNSPSKSWLCLSTPVQLRSFPHRWVLLAGRGLLLSLLLARLRRWTQVPHVRLLRLFLWGLLNRAWRLNEIIMNYRQNVYTGVKFTSCDTCFFAAFESPYAASRLRLAFGWAFLGEGCPGACSLVGVGESRDAGCSAGSNLTKNQVGCGFLLK